jgi:small subunit ribosomal protein S17
MKDTIKQQKMIRCRVRSDKMNKSRVGVVERKVKHPVVGKYITRTTKVMFHDENNLSHIGDEVLIRQTKPISGQKTFVLDSIVHQSQE